MKKTNELKKILLGRVGLNAEGYMAVLPKGKYPKFNGLLDGSLSVMTLGVMMRSWGYTTTLSEKAARSHVETYLLQIGRPLKLEDNPDAIACFTGYIAMTPTIAAVEFEKMEKQEDAEEGSSENLLKVIVTICTGRSLFGSLRCLIVHGRVKRKFGDLFDPLELPTEEKKHKKRKKESSES